MNSEEGLTIAAVYTCENPECRWEKPVGRGHPVVHCPLCRADVFRCELSEQNEAEDETPEVTELVNEETPQ